MRRLLIIIGAAVAAVAGAFVYWRRNPRAGTRFMNEVLDPFLLARGLSGTGASEIGTIEHIGRRTGSRHLTPVHPVPTADGFRIVVPLGARSEWANNVLAAGHCRLQLHDTIHDLDEPALISPMEIDELSPALRAVADRLGFRYLRLHTFRRAPGALEPLPGVRGSGAPGPTPPERVGADAAAPRDASAEGAVAAD
jgi:hypothetical protein